MPSLMSLRRASNARFFFSICWTSARNSSERMEMSGLFSPAACRMSTISVETTARLTICWMASSRSCRVTPEPAPLLARAAPDGLEETDFLADGSRLVRGRRQGIRLGQGQHGILIAPMRVLLALLGRFLSGQPLLQVEYPLDGAGHHGQAFLG